MPKDTTEEDRARSASRIEGVLTGRVVSLAGPLVLVGYEIDGAASVVEARCLAPVEGLVAGQTVALMFEGGEADRPLVLGPIRDGAEAGTALTVAGDAEGVALSHPRKLRLVCGRSSITLHADGRLELTGDHVTSLARGTNRMGGASVKIN